MSDGGGSQRRISTKCAHNAPWETTEKLTAPVFDQKAQERLAAKRSGAAATSPQRCIRAGAAASPPPRPPLLVGDEVLRYAPQLRRVDDGQITALLVHASRLAQRRNRVGDGIDVHAEHLGELRVAEGDQNGVGGASEFLGEFQQQSREPLQHRVHRRVDRLARLERQHGEHIPDHGERELPVLLQAGGKVGGVYGDDGRLHRGSGVEDRARLVLPLLEALKTDQGSRLMEKHGLGVAFARVAEKLDQPLLYEEGMRDVAAFAEQIVARVERDGLVAQPPRLDEFLNACHQSCIRLDEKVDRLHKTPSPERGAPRRRKSRLSL